MKIHWVFDLLSPYSYLGLQQLRGLPGGIQVELVPVLFAGLLNHHGQVGNAEIESKRRFTYRFVVWRARKMGVPLKMPPTHPFNPLNALRLRDCSRGPISGQRRLRSTSSGRRAGTCRMRPCCRTWHGRSGLPTRKLL